MRRHGAIGQPLLLATALAVGAGVVWAMAVGWGMMVGGQLLRGEREYESLVLQVDGTPLIQTRSGDYYYVETYRTLDGKPVAAEEVRFGLYAAALDAAPPARRDLGRMEWRYRILGYTDLREPPIIWYLIHSGQREGSGYFAGYDSESKQPVGYIGRGGSRPDTPPHEDRFPVDSRRLGHRNNFGAVSSYDYPDGREPYRYSSGGRPAKGQIPPSTVFLISGERLLEVDLQERAVREVMTAPELVSVNLTRRALPEIPPNDDDESTSRPVLSQNLAVRLKDRILVRDTLSGQRRRYQIPSELGRRHFSFVELADGTAIAWLTGPRGGPLRRNELCWFDPSGQILRREEVLLKSRGSYLGPKTQALLQALELPAPVAMTLAATVFEPRRYLSRGKASTYGEALAEVASDFWPALVVTYLLGVGLAWVCRRRQQQYAARWTALWIVFVFVFGAAGIFGYLLHRSWAARPACPKCGRPSPRDREACFACGADFPEPAPKGIEVFAG